MKKLEDKRTFEDVALFASMLKGGKSVDKLDIMIGLLMVISDSQCDENGVYVINDPKYKKKIYSREDLIQEIRADKYKFEELNNRLENVRKYIKKQLGKYDIKFESVIQIHTDNSVAPGKRTTYYQYVDPEYDLMKSYVRGINEDADFDLMIQIDRRHDISEDFNIENIKKAFSFQEKYSQRLKDRIIAAIKEIHIDKDLLQSVQSGKILKTLEYALVLNDPIKIACLLRRYAEFSETDRSGCDIESVSHSAGLINDCINVIEGQLGNTVKDLEKISKGISLDELFGESSEIFDSVIYFLRKSNSRDLPDALFSYGKYCVSILDYPNAEKYFRECLSFYAQDDVSTIGDRIVIHNNLGNLYCKWYRLPDAEQHIKISIGLIERWAGLMPEEPNYILSLSYDSLASVLSKSFKFEDAESALDKAYEYIVAEQNKDTYKYDPKIEYQSLAIAHNSAFLNYEKGDAEALLSLELPVYKVMLLAKLYPSAENILLSAILHITYADGVLKTGDCDYAMSLVNNALLDYDKLCDISYRRYAIAKTFGLQRLSDVFESMGRNNDAVSTLQEAQKICESFDLKTNFEARKRRIEILNNLSGLLVEERRYLEAIVNCEEIINEYQALSSIDYVQFSFEIVKELDNMAIAYYLSGDRATAHAKLQDASSALEDLRDEIGDEMYNEWYMKLTEDAAKFV